MLNLDLLRQRLLGPFKPFALRLSDGRRFDVPRPDFIAVGRGVVVVIDEKDISHTIDGLHIVSLEEAYPVNG